LVTNPSSSTATFRPASDAFDKFCIAAKENFPIDVILKDREKEIPVEGSAASVVISNPVINLTIDKVS
jgi:hypothetical protein